MRLQGLAPRDVAPYLTSRSQQSGSVSGYGDVGKYIPAAALTSLHQISRHWNENRDFVVAGRALITLRVLETQRGSLYFLD